MRRLGGGVDDERDVFAKFSEKILHGRAVADVEIVMLVIGNGVDELLPVAERGSLLAEKPLAQVVVNADNFKTLTREAFDAFRTDQPGRAGDNNNVHKNAFLIICIQQDCGYGCVASSTTL